MAPPKLRPTAGDYLLAANAPAFIIGMISCLVFFLVTIVYRGDFTFRLMYLLGLYTFASVLIARIAIEQSRTLALSYTFALGLVTLLVVMRFVQFPGSAVLGFPIVVGFLVLIGFLADRITHDCTLIDETHDASGVGLLQSLGLIKSLDRSKRKNHNPGVWVLYFALLALPLFGLGQIAIPANDSLSQSRAFWFLFGYLFFSLSLLVTTSFLGLRRYLRQRGVMMLPTMSTVWLVSGMAGVLLILLISLLLPLPGRSAGLIELPAFLTSPDGLQASRWGWGPEGKGSGGNPSSQSTDDQGDGQQQKSQAGSEPSNGAERNGGNDDQNKGQNEGQGDSQPPSDSSGKSSPSPSSGRETSSKEQPGHRSEPETDRPSSTDDKSPSNRPSDDKRSSDRKPASDRKALPKDAAASNGESDSSQGTTEQGKEIDRSEEGASSTSDQSKSSNEGTGNPSTADWFPSLPNIASLFQWVTIALLLLIIFVYLVLHGRELWTFLVSLFRKEKETSQANEKNGPALPSMPRSFLSFKNPFAGKLGWPPAKIVEYTFEAVEAWGHEKGLARDPQETPEEFLNRFAKVYGDQADVLMKLSQLYNGVAYAGGRIPNQDVQKLSHLWNWLGGANHR